MAGHAHRRQAGFTYVGMIVFVAIIGLVGAATLKVGALLARAEAEHELLEIGAEFGAALASYAQATPAGQPQQPLSLEALLRDPRFPLARRHLRRIFVDPITGRAEWGLVRAGEGGPITGIYSLSKAQPLKLANFDVRFTGFENKQHLSEWVFTAREQNGAAPGAPIGAVPVPPVPPAAPPVPGSEPPAIPPPAPETPAEPPAEPEPAEPAPAEPAEPAPPPDEGNAVDGQETRSGL